ncbi:hypothetical protein EJK48_1797 [Moraxella catarrhalis]|uniref:Uncharacterized protein n=1 Tax=Moraxella catarrhalis TaxID=480 RepID=A0A3S9QE93_MORCA|nr:hypothetical protein EJK53_1961 [Moraxella catarrhalis]AZQ95993.1 hypothetical protein EJK48_1797 [Moraxella catarrhalis]
MSGAKSPIKIKWSGCIIISLVCYFVIIIGQNQTASKAALPKY